MREAEAKLDEYEKNVVAEITALTAHYEGFICYLMQKYCGGILPYDEVREWAKGKEFALVSELDEDEELIWEAIVIEVKDESEKE